MSDHPFEETERDILVGLRVELKYIRQAIDGMAQEVDLNAGAIRAHEESIKNLTWGFRLIVGGVVTVLCGVMVYALTHA